VGTVRALRREGDIRLSQKQGGCAVLPDDEIGLRKLPHLCKKPGGCSRPGPDDDRELVVRDLPSLSRAA
jgi:hypothetical protein